MYRGRGEVAEVGGGVNWKNLRREKRFSLTDESVAIDGWVEFMGCREEQKPVSVLTCFG